MNLSLNLLKNKQKKNLLNHSFDLKKKLEIHDLAFIKKTNSFKFLKKSHVTNKWISWINKLNLEPTLLNNQTFYENKRREQNLKKNPIYKSGYSKIHELKLVSINIASPNKIKEWAEKVLPNGKVFGEVTNANTLHYKTFKPHKGGLFCERIFGPLKDFECACGIRSKPTELESKRILEHEQTIRNFCPNCDVEYTWSVIRRYQLGYIQLVSPVSHIWFLKANPSYLSLLLDLRRSHLESIIYCTESITLEHLWKSSQNLGIDTSPSVLYSIWQKLLEEEKLMKKKKLHIKTLIKNSNFSFFLNQKEKQLKQRLYFIYLYKKDSQYDENFPKLNLDMSKISAFNEKLKKNSIQNSLYIYKDLDFFLKNKIGTNKQSKKIFKIYSKMLKFIYKKSFIQALFIRKKSFLFLLRIAFFKDLFNTDCSKSSQIFDLKATISNSQSMAFEQIINVYEKKILDFKEEFLDFAEFFLRIYFFKLFVYNQTDFEKTFLSDSNIRTIENLYNKTYKNMPSEKNSFKNILFEFFIFCLINIKLNFYNKKNPFKILSLALKTKDLNVNKNQVSFDLKPKKERKILKLKKQNKKNKKIMVVFSKIRKEMGHRQKLFYYSGFSIEKKLIKLDSFFEKTKKEKFLKSLFQKLNKHETKENYDSNSYKNVEFIRQIKSKIDLLVLRIENSRPNHRFGPNKNKKYLNKFLYFIYDCFVQNNDLFLFDNIDYKEKWPILDLKSLILKSKKNDIYSLKVFYFLEFYMENHKTKFSEMLDFINFIYYLKLPFFRIEDSRPNQIFLESKIIENQDFRIEPKIQVGIVDTAQPSKHNLNKNKINRFDLSNFKHQSFIQENSILFKTDFQNLSLKKNNPLPRKKSFFNEINSLNKRKKALFLQKQKALTFRKPLFSKKQEGFESFSLFKQSNFFDSSRKSSIFDIEDFRYQKFSNKKKKNIYLKNDLYTISYSHLWSFMADWKSFFYYNSAPKDFEDVHIYSFSNGNVSNQEYSTEFVLKLENPLAGAAIVKKLLSEYNTFELKKMVKQHQVLLPKLNSYIRQLKEKAIKKLDFVKIQKLLNKRDHIIRRLKLIRKFSRKDVDPTSMILSVLPVLPPDLRPILKLENQIAASDLNRLYQRIIFRNERLKKFLKDPSTSQSFEMKYAQRLLQESVDNLIQNGKGNVKPETNSRGQALKSLSEILKGKQGRFRQYLLGKRVDYSGRSVIVVGPKLKLYECGLPKEMAIELFLPFLIKKILHYKIARTVIGAKNFLYSNKTYCINLLYEIMKNHPVLLNRAPTLHRLGIQAFRPKLVEGRAILLHPLVCPAFNADFDGDQMAVHVPITVEARAEAWTLLFSRNHLISPATGDPIILPSQDMVLGCYYLTSEKNLLNQKKKLLNSKMKEIKLNFIETPIRTLQNFSPCFTNFEKILNAYQLGNISLQSIVWFKWNGRTQFMNEPISLMEMRLINNGNRDKIQSKSYKSLDKKGRIQNQYIRTTPGRILMNSMAQKCINL